MVLKGKCFLLNLLSFLTASLPGSVQSWASDIVALTDLGLRLLLPLLKMVIFPMFQRTHQKASSGAILPSHAPDPHLVLTFCDLQPLTLGQQDRAFLFFRFYLYPSTFTSASHYKGKRKKWGPEACVQNEATPSFLGAALVPGTLSEGCPPPFSLSHSSTSAPREAAYDRSRWQPAP